MLKELRKYNNLGSSGYYWEVLRLFYKHPDNDWNKASIDAYFKGRIIDDKDIFDGGLPLLKFAGVLEEDISGNYYLTRAFRHKLHTLEHCKGRILEALLDTMKNDEATYSIFSTEYCSFDFVNNVIQIDRSAFGLQYANLRDLLINLDFLQPHPNFPKQSFAVNRSRKNIFDRYLTDEIRKRRISPDQLRNIQQQQQENGLLGEKFVIEYEMRRTGRDIGIEWIASYDTTAGFDILSFESSVSVIHDRFIEVKAYSGPNPYFYWSKNEVNVAKHKENQYFIYLINIEEFNDAGYEPLIIQNPSIQVLDSTEWLKTVDKYQITYVG